MTLHLHPLAQGCECPSVTPPPPVYSAGFKIKYCYAAQHCRGDISSPVVVPRLATSDPPLPLCLYFTADRRSARAPPARVIYDQQLLLQPMTLTAGCQMWSPCKQKRICNQTSVEGWTEKGVGVERREGQVGQRWSGKFNPKKKKERNRMRGSR